MVTVPPRPIYAGIGELDGNRAMIQRAVRESALHNIAVTLDVWEGLRTPRTGPLRVAATSGQKKNAHAVDPLLDEAVTRFDAGTLEMCRYEYLSLAESAPGTIFGAVARRAAERTDALLK